MKKLVNLVLAAVMVASLFGVATADQHNDVSNYQQFKASWYYPWIGPGNDEYGNPSMGTGFAQKASGEVIYLDSTRMLIEADGSGDMMTFYLYPGITQYTPSLEGVRVGSKVKVKSDDVSRARTVHVVPFYMWLAEQTN